MSPCLLLSRTRCIIKGNEQYAALQRTFLAHVKVRVCGHGTINHQLTTPSTDVLERGGCCIMEKVNKWSLNHCKPCVASLYSYNYKGTNRFPNQHQFHSLELERAFSSSSFDRCAMYSINRFPSFFSSIPRPLHSPFIVNPLQLQCRPISSFSQDIHRKHLDQRSKQSSNSFHTSSFRWKEESKVEKTVKALKESVITPEATKISQIASEETTLVVPKKTITQRVIDVIKHYYHGFRLLFIDLKICSKLIWHILNGDTLTRREYKQLVRTTADMFRLLPMLVFVLVPFAEFLLPVALKLFPNMLPSTFAEEKTEKEKVKKTLKAKIEMAKFLQQTLKESAVMAKKQEGHTESFSSFLDQIRDQGIKPKTKDIMRFAKLFEDEITLDNLSRQQLRACSIMLGITPMGSDALLRFLLQMKLRRLLADDKMIQKEGVESLTIAELQAANRARGMRALGVSEERLRDQLKQWMQLHLEEKIPTSLLLLSRALYLSETLSTEEKISATITQLADTATNEAKVKVAEMSGEKVDNKSKLDIIQHEEAIIAAEKEQMELEAKMQIQAQRDAAEAKAAEVAMETSDAAKASEMAMSDELVDTAKVLEPSPSEELLEETSISTKDLGEMEDVLEKIAVTRKIDTEQDALKYLKEEVCEYKEDLEDLKDISVARGQDEKEYCESKAAKRLMKKIDRMITSLDQVVENIQTETSHIEEKLAGEDKAKEVLNNFQQDQDKIKIYKHNIISLHELADALNTLKDAPNDGKLKQIFEVLDQDKDGKVDLNQALKVLELLSHEHLELKASQVNEVIELLKNEAKLEEAELEQEREKKGKKQQEKEQQQI